MPAIVVRNISAETHRALRVRARKHGRSTEAEIRAILDGAVRPTARVKLGSALAALVSDRRQLAQLDYLLARFIAEAATGTAGPRGRP